MIPLIWTVLGPALLGLYNAYLLLDDKTQESSDNNLSLEKKWKFFGACVFLYTAAGCWMLYGYKYAILSMCCFWTVFSFLVHTIALKKSPFYVGTVAFTDKAFRSLFPKNTEVWSAVLKLLVLAASVVYVFV